MSFPSTTRRRPSAADDRVRAGVGGERAADRLLPLPLLLVHGTDDKGYGEALQLYNAAQEPKQLVTIQGAGHGICQDNDARPHAVRVAELTTAFWDRHLREGRPVL